MDKYKKSELTKAKIIQQANLLFSNKGFHATGVDEIVESVGLTSGSFYAQFKSKVDVYNHVVNYRITESSDFFLKARAGESAAGWLQRVFTDYLSVSHVVSREKACPLTIFSSEILSVDSQSKNDLDFYQYSFSEIMQRRLNLVLKENNQKATLLLSTCIGAVSAARLKGHSSEAKDFLNQVFNEVMTVIKLKDPLQMPSLK